MEKKLLLDEKNRCKCGMIDTMLYLRKAEISDMDMLLELANDECVRANAFNTSKIGDKEHQEWYRKLLSNDNQRQYILMKNTKMIGQIRISINDSSAEVDYSIVPESRGHGYGKEIIRLLIEAIKYDYPNVRILTGKVKPENVSSINCFIGNGFSEIYREYEYILDKQ